MSDHQQIMEDDEEKWPVIQGTRAAEVLSIKLKKINDGSEKCELYGTIRVQDEEGTVCLYDRSPDNAETVYLNGPLSLVGPKERPISAFTSFEVFLDLKDKSGKEFIRNSFIVDSKHNDHSPFHEKCSAIDVDGEMGVATVNFAVLQVAVLACISAWLIKEDDSSNCSDVHVYGSLITHYGERFDAKEDDGVVLFEKVAEKRVQLVKVEDRYSIPLSRYFVVVPGYSSITIEGVLHCGIDSDGPLESVKIYEDIQANERGVVKKEIKVKHATIKVIVFWTSSFAYHLYRDYILGCPRHKCLN